MVNPKLRFPGYTDEWQEHSVGSMTRELHEYNTLESGLPLMTSSRNGIMLQSDYRGSITTDSEDAQFSVVHRGDCTYRHMSDDDIFHFNINTIADAGLVSKEYPVFECVAGNSLPLLVEYLNSSKRFLKFCREQKMGGTRTRLYYSRLCEFSFPFPSVEEQEQIVDLFDCINETIANQEKYIAALETQKKELLRQVFAREIRFKDENGQDYPEWKERRLGDIASFITKGTTPQEYAEDSEICFVRIDSIQNGIINAEKCLHIDESTHRKALARSILQEGDILCSIAGALGVIAIVPKDLLPANTNQALAIVRLPEDENKRYIAYFLRSFVMDKFIQESKTVGAQPNLSLRQINDIVIAYPSLPEQQRIADFFKALDAQIENERALLEDWRQLKKGLLQQMFV